MEVFRIAKQCMRGPLNGEKSIQRQENDKKMTWKSKYDRLLKVRNTCDIATPTRGLATKVDSNLVDKVLKDMKREKIIGSTGILAKMARIFSEVRVEDFHLGS